MDYTFNITEINRLFKDIEHVFNNARINIKLASLLHNRVTMEQMDELQELTNRAVSLLAKIRLEDGADVRKAVSSCLSVYGRYLDNLDTPPDIVEVVGLSEHGITESRKEASIHPSWNRYNGKLRNLAEILQPLLSSQSEQIKEQVPEQSRTDTLENLFPFQFRQRIMNIYKRDLLEDIRSIITCNPNGKEFTALAYILYKGANISGHQTFRKWFKQFSEAVGMTKTEYRPSKVAEDISRLYQTLYYLK